MAKAFADRWGGFRSGAGSADAVALLDSAIEDLAALGGRPGGGRRRRGSRPTTAWYSAISTAPTCSCTGRPPEGVAAAGEILKRLDETFMGERGAAPPARRPALGRR